MKNIEYTLLVIGALGLGFGISDPLYFIGSGLLVIASSIFYYTNKIVP